MRYNLTFGHIRHIKSGIYKRVDAYLKSTGKNLVSTQISIVLHLHFYQTTRITDLADKMDITNSTANYMITKLEQEGLVEKKQDKTDKRIYNVELTQKAKDDMDFYINIMNDNLELLYKDFTDLEKEIFFKLLLKMSKNCN